jgi:hypothetical protein
MAREKRSFPFSEFDIPTTNSSENKWVCYCSLEHERCCEIWYFSRDFAMWFILKIFQVNSPFSQLDPDLVNASRALLGPWLTIPHTRHLFPFVKLLSENFIKIMWNELVTIRHTNDSPHNDSPQSMTIRHS